jgi:rhamnogalacturonan acetylesterase
MRPFIPAVIVFALTANSAFSQTTPATIENQKSGAAPTIENLPKPTLYLIGDSTVNNHSNGGLGYGDPLAKLFDPAKITVKNTAIAGRSARSFYSEGRWDGPTGIKNLLKPGDFVLMEMGTNDGPGSIQQIATLTNGRPDLAGLGDETTQGPNSSPQHTMETVHTFGWYMTKYVVETKAKGATPVMLTMIPHNAWTNQPGRGRAGAATTQATATAPATAATAPAEPPKLRRAEVNTFVKWSRQIADNENIFFIDQNQIVATRLEKETPAEVTTKYFTLAGNPPTDATHTSPAGAQLNAECVVMGIRALKDLKLNDYLTEDAKKLDPTEEKNVRTIQPTWATKP